MRLGYPTPEQMDEAVQAVRTCDTAIKGKTKYCGYVIGEDITCEQVERLYHFLHANYKPVEFIQLTDDELHQIAENSKEEWQ